MGVRFIRALSSAKLAAVLIAALLALGVVSFLVPQRPHSALTQYERWREEHPVLAAAARSVGADDAFGSPPFLAVAGLLALNLAACTLVRMRPSAARAPRVPAKPPEGAFTASLPLSSAEVTARLPRFGPGWRVHEARDGERRYVLMDSSGWARAGSLVLHAGFLLVILGGLVSSLTRFDGRMVLTEGQALPDAPASYAAPPREPRLGRAYHDLVVRLDSLRFDYERGYVTQARARVTFESPRGARLVEAAVNTPARHEGRSFLLVRGGHAVAFGVTDAEGKPLFSDSVVRLGEAVEGGYADSVPLADGGVLALRTIADGRRPERARREPLRLADPVVTFALPAEDATVALRAGETADLGGVVVRLGDVRLWNEFAVREDRGIPVTYTAFAVILAGASIRFASGKRRVGWLITPAPGGSEVAVWASDRGLAAHLYARLTKLDGRTAA